MKMVLLIHLLFLHPGPVVPRWVLGLLRRPRSRGPAPSASEDHGLTEVSVVRRLSDAVVYQLTPFLVSANDTLLASVARDSGPRRGLSRGIVWVPVYGRLVPSVPCPCTLPYLSRPWR